MKMNKNKNSKLGSISDPYSELAVRNAKYIKNCTELYMANRNISTLANFEHFVSLEMLWINDNKIEKLDGLDNCFRLKELYAQNNLLTSLNGSLKNLVFMQSLSLSNNCLRDLQDTTKILSSLTSLKSLDLYGNPLAEESNYRMHVVFAIPSLHVFDRHVVTGEEKQWAANAYYKKCDIRENIVIPTALPNYNHSAAVKLMIKEINEENHVKAAAASHNGRFESGDLEVSTKDNSFTVGNKMMQKNFSGLCYWQISYLRSFFSKHDAKNSGCLSRENFDESVLKMKDYGAVLALGSTDIAEEDTDAIEARALSVAATVFGDESSSQVYWVKFLESCITGESGHERERFLWRRLNTADLEILASDMFEKAKSIQKKMLSLSDSSPQKLSLINEAHELSNTACRLESLTLNVGEIESGTVTKFKVPSRADIFSTLSYSRATPRSDADTLSTSHTKEPQYKLKNCHKYLTFLEKKKNQLPMVAKRNKHIILQ